MGKGAVVGFGVVMLAIGAALGFALRPADRSAVAEVAGDSPSIGPAADLGESATIAALRERVKSLEAELASRREGKREDKVNFSRPDRQRPGPGRDDFEKFKAENPEAWARMEKEMQRRVAEHREHEGLKAEFVSSVDVSGWSDAARANHEAYLDELSAREELLARMFDGELDEDERRALFDAMRESSMRIRRLQEIERENLLATAVRNVGLSHEDAEELVETIQDVYEATNSGRGGPDGPPPPPPPQEAR